MMKNGKIICNCSGILKRVLLLHLSVNQHKEIKLCIFVATKSLKIRVCCLMYTLPIITQSHHIGKSSNQNLRRARVTFRPPVFFVNNDEVSPIQEL